LRPAAVIADLSAIGARAISPATAAARRRCPAGVWLCRGGLALADALDAFFLPRGASGASFSSWRRSLRRRVPVRGAPGTARGIRLHVDRPRRLPPAAWRATRTVRPSASH